MKIEKPEKVVGYVLLVIGLIFIIFPAVLAYLMFSSGVEVPQLVPTPTGGTDAFIEAFATFSNVCLIFFTFIVIMWAGSIISNRGVALIKMARESFLESVEIFKEKKKKS